MRLSTNGGLVLNSSYSQWKEVAVSQGQVYHSSARQLGGNIIKPGCWLGLNAIVGKKSRRFMLGLSAFYTQYQYKLEGGSRAVPYFSTQLPNAYRSTNYNINVYGRSLSLNAEIGFRRHLFYPLSIQHLLIAHTVLSRTEKLKGNFTEAWSNNLPGSYYEENTPINNTETNSHYTDVFRYKAVMCYRLAVFWELNLRNKKIELMFFRNVALSSLVSLPFWGTGLNYVLGKNAVKDNEWRAD